MFFLECHHAIGKLPASPLSDYVWERLPLGGQETFLDQNDPQIAPIVNRFLIRPDIIGVRLVYQPDAAVAAVAGVPIVAVSPTAGAVLATFGQ
jgi:hypothetical protein